jgi:hypothetical protein
MCEGESLLYIDPPGIQYPECRRGRQLKAFYMYIFFLNFCGEWRTARNDDPVPAFAAVATLAMEGGDTNWDTYCPPTGRHLDAMFHVNPLNEEKGTVVVITVRFIPQ